MNYSSSIAVLMHQNTSTSLGANSTDGKPFVIPNIRIAVQLVMIDRLVKNNPGWLSLHGKLAMKSVAQ
jgi:hypothetical protein